MKTKEIARKYGFDQIEFDKFLNNQNEIPISGLIETSVSDAYVDLAVERFKAFLDAEAALQKAKNAEAEAKAREKEEAEARAKAEKERIRMERQQLLDSIIVSSVSSFEGYSIKKYHGLITKDYPVQINRDGFYSSLLNGKILDDYRLRLLDELKLAAHSIGCNAVIGTRFDYISFEPESISTFGDTHYYEPYVIVVTVSGTAVVIEKE